MHAWQHSTIGIAAVALCSLQLTQLSHSPLLILFCCCFPSCFDPAPSLALMSAPPPSNGAGGNPAAAGMNRNQRKRFWQKQKKQQQQEQQPQQAAEAGQGGDGQPQQQ